MCKNLIGQIVVHKTYGRGQIQSISKDGSMFIKFLDNSTKRYNYPQDFEDNLSIENNDFKEQIKRDLEISSGKLGIFKVDNFEYLGMRDDSKEPLIEIDPNNIKSLEIGKCYGHVAKDIYLCLCNNPNFLWNTTKAGNFSSEKPLYAKNCTKEGLSVIFYSSSTYNQKVAKIDILNAILNDGNEIKSIWGKNAKVIPSEELNEKKIVFVKNKFGQYIYWGIMKVIEIRDKTKPFVVAMARNV